MSSPNPPRRRRRAGNGRAPDNQRQRTLISCDRCKERRVRCEQLSMSGTGPCRRCVASRVQCKFTIPRKTRIYGSVETLSARFRVLQELVKGMFPEKDTSDTLVLYEIAAEHQINIPDFTANTDTPIEDVFSQIPEGFRGASPIYSDASQQTMQDEPTPVVRSTTLPSSRQGRLVPTPTGQTSNFIGPSSSFGFVLTARSFAGEYADKLRVQQPNYPNLKLMKDFADSNRSQALESNVAEGNDTAPGPADLQPDALMSWSPHVIPAMTSKDFHFSPETPLSLLLPTREIADDLVSSFFRRVHPNFMIFQRHSFEQSYALMWGQLDIQVQGFEVGSLCSVLMVLVLGAQSLERPVDPYLEMIRRYSDWVKHEASGLLLCSSLVNVQALLLLHLYQHNVSERNTAFMMLGAASRMATNLGMHREGAIKNLDPIQQELRRRIWWTIYVLEHNSCTILGRPCAIDDREISVRFPNEDLLDGSECVPSGYVENLVQLTKIMAEISRRMYPLSSIPSRDSEYQRINNAKTLLFELDSWNYRLPGHLRLDSQTSSANHTRAIGLLHLQFHLTQSLVARPFLLQKVAVQVARSSGKHVRSQELDEEELKLSSQCGLFSKQAIILAHELITSNQFNGVTWIDSYYVYHSVLVVSLDFLAKEEEDTEEDLSRKKAVFDIKNAMDKIRLCPLYAMLTQVGFQLAEIVGIIDNHASCYR